MDKRGAVILSGGKGRRIGAPKAFIKLNGEPLILHVLEKVKKEVGEIIVVIDRDDDPSSYASILPSGVLIVKDYMAGIGPLAGIFTGMQNLKTEYAVVLPCDTPFVKESVIKFLFDVASGVDAAVPRWPNRYIEPLQAVYRVVSSLRAARRALEEGERRVYGMIKRLGKVLYISVEELRRLDPDLLTFFNVNTEGNLERARLLLKEL